MRNPRPPTVSFVIATHNRCDIVLDTVARLGSCGLDRSDYEIIVVDNMSTDAAIDFLDSRVDSLIRLRRNAGSCAKAYGVERARGRYVVFLDDDSHPREGSVSRMIERFEADRRLGAAGFTVLLPSGRREGAALPGVFVGCGVGFRAEALRQVGGLDATLFMQAEEYDLSFRLVAAGWKIAVFDDLHVEHLKTHHGRRSSRTVRLDTRNNVLVAARYLPPSHYGVYLDDHIQRYRWLAQMEGHVGAHRWGLWSGRWRAVFDRHRYRACRLPDSALEFFFRWDEIERNMRGLARDGVRRIVLADLGKNIYAFHRGAARAGLRTVAIGDDRFSARRRFYRRIPVVPIEFAMTRPHDAVVVANSSAVHGAVTCHRWRRLSQRPVWHWVAHTGAIDGVSGTGTDGQEAWMGERSVERCA